MRDFCLSMWNHLLQLQRWLKQIEPLKQKWRRRLGLLFLMCNNLWCIRHWNRTFRRSECLSLFHSNYHRLLLEIVWEKPFQNFRNAHVRPSLKKKKIYHVTPVINRRETLLSIFKSVQYFSHSRRIVWRKESFYCQHSRKKLFNEFEHTVWFLSFFLSIYCFCFLFCDARERVERHITVTFYLVGSFLSIQNTIFSEGA